MKVAVRRADGIAGVIDILMEYALYLLLFFVPVSNSLAEILAVSLIFLALMKRALAVSRSGAPHVTARIKRGAVMMMPMRTPVDLPVYCFLGASLVSSALSEMPAMSLMAFITKPLEYVLVFFIAAETLDSAAKVRRSIAVIFSILFLACLDGLFQHFTGADLVRHYPIIRAGITAFFKHPNSFAAYLILVMPLVVTFLLFAGRKVFTSALFILSSVSLILTFSRGAFLGGGSALMLIGAYARKTIVIVLLVICALLVLLFPGQVAERAGTISKTTWHLPIWREPVKILKDNPFLGIGVGLYSEIAPRYKAVEYGGVYPHNSYLHLAAETGVFGILAFLWVLFGLLRIASVRFIRLGSAVPSGEVVFFRAVILGIAAGLFAFAVQSFFDVNFFSLKLAMMFWTHAGILVSVIKLSGTFTPARGA